MDTYHEGRPRFASRNLSFGAFFLAALFGCARTSDSGAVQDVDGAAREAPSNPAPIVLPGDPKAALAALRAASMQGPVAVFKHSPICPISGAAHERFHLWLKSTGTASDIKHAHIDVIGEKPLARGLVAELGIQHESPQLLLFHQGEVVWHASHGAITEAALTEQLLLID